jgi:hypothetical protein
MAKRSLEDLLQVDEEGYILADYELIYGRGGSKHIKSFDDIYVGALCGTGITFGTTSLFSKDSKVCAKCVSILRQREGVMNGSN